MRAPPIRIRCDCGEERAVAYGELWQCESCGRRWNTRQIPAEEYWGVLREVRRYRALVVGVALAAAAAIFPLALLVSERFFFLLFVTLGAWAFYVMPFWRRRMRRKLRDLPRWQLHPE